MKIDINEFIGNLEQRTPGENEFHQAVEEVVGSVWDFYSKNPRYQKAKILERMCEPERVIMFRVPWVDDKGEVQINVTSKIRKKRDRSQCPRYGLLGDWGTVGV